MWTCSKCSESVDDEFDKCWNCGTSLAGEEDPDFQQEEEPAETAGSSDASAAGGMRVAFQHFKAGSFTSWEELFQEAANFATEIGPDSLISIFHSDDKGTGVVTVWYWEEA